MNLPRIPKGSNLKPSPLRRLRTERPNQAANNLDQKSSLEIAQLINAEDATVAQAVSRVLPQVARAIDKSPPLSATADASSTSALEPAAASPLSTLSSASPHSIPIPIASTSSSPEAQKL